MRHDTQFAVRYLTNDPVPIREIVESLLGVETVINETVAMLPRMIDGLTIQSFEIKVREIAQESPLRELFLVSLIIGFQQDLERHVPDHISALTGIEIPDNMDSIVTILAMIIVFYGIGALKDLVTGNGQDGESARQLNNLVAALSADTGKTEKQIRNELAEKFSEPSKIKKLANATTRFLLPSKRQGGVAVEVNEQTIATDVMREVPADYVVEHEEDSPTSRSFTGVRLELHAQDRDHTGKGWAAIVRGVSEKRLRLKLMDEVSATDLWGNDAVEGDITVIYAKVGADMVPTEIHLHRISRAG